MCPNNLYLFDFSRITVTTLKLCLIGSIILFVIIPFIFKYSLKLQQGILFLTFSKFGGILPASYLYALYAIEIVSIVCSIFCTYSCTTLKFSIYILRRFWFTCNTKFLCNKSRWGQRNPDRCMAHFAKLYCKTLREGA